MVSDKKLANAMSGKTARACDSCIRKRARWYCTADDAFLCQACDASVHSANSLARRHERVRLKTSSFKYSSEVENQLPSWHYGFTRKARTTRHGKHTKPKLEEPIPNGPNPLLLVPEIGSDHEENNEEQLLYRVPIFDPFAAELCTSANSNEAEINGGNDIASFENKSKAVLLDYDHDVNCLHGFLPSEMDLAEFAADVESLLGKGLDEESFDMEGLGLLDCKEKDIVECSLGSGKVKVEDEEIEVFMANQVDMEIDMTRKQFELNFDYDFTANCDEDDKVISGEVMGKNMEEECKLEDKKKKILLRLDYEGVITAWADQRSPWTTGERPELDTTDCWPDCMGNCGTIHYQYGDMATMGGHNAMVDGGREARVSRYREKRRTRLFSKKIRYEVRKLNAEKRPRMKGRFVKRSNFSGTTFPLLNK